MDSTRLIVKHAGMPEIKAGDRVTAKTRRGAEMGIVLLRAGFRIRIRTDSGREFSIDRASVRLLRQD
jgi:hypothetical protein